MTKAAGKNHDPWTERRFRAQASRALHRTPPSSPANSDAGRANFRSDFDNNKSEGLKQKILSSHRPAAVLVPIVRRQELTVLLTKRASHLSNHAGQIAFPGGKIEKSDAGPMAAALREAEEEIGLHSNFVEPVGYLDSYLTGTGFHIVPLVAMIEPDFSLTLDPSEVDDAFEVPLSFLMDTANHEVQTREWRGHQVSYYAMPYGERFIWGATAGMIRNMHERLIRE